MATQQHVGGLPFAIAHELQQFRLLELPPELLDLIDDPNAPPSLSIKSLPVAQQGQQGAANAKPAYAVLCTPDRSYQLRQVQTSNTLYLTTPTLDAHGNDIPVPTTTAIAEVPATLELHPVDAIDADAHAYLEAVVPVYDWIDGEVDAEENHRSRPAIFADIPLSDAQCDAAWRSLIAFEVAGSSYRPSAKTLAHVWASVNAAALAEGVKLDTQFLADDLATLVAEEGYPKSLAMSLICHLSSVDQRGSSEWACLDKEKTLPFVGKILLEARRDSTDYLTADFLDAWKDSVPEVWRKDADLKVIDGLYDLPSSKTIRTKPKPLAAATQTATPKASASRKWHEKFAKTRKK